jgi:serine/threonine protein kinase
MHWDEDRNVFTRISTSKASETIPDTNLNVFSESEAIHYFCDIVDGLAHLHSVHSIIHRFVFSILL